MENEGNVNNSKLTSKKHSKGGFLSFRKMITIPVIKVVYVIFAILITIAGIAGIFVNNELPFSDNSALGIILGLISIIVANIVWRIICEVCVVFFRIHEELVFIRNKLENIK